MYWSQDLEGVGDDGRTGNLLEKTQCKKVIFSKEKGEFIFQSQMDESNPLEEIKT